MSNDVFSIELYQTQSFLPLCVGFSSPSQNPLTIQPKINPKIKDNISLDRYFTMPTFPLFPKRFFLSMIASTITVTMAITHYLRF